MPKRSKICWQYRNRRANIEVTFQLPTRDGRKVTKRLIADTGAPVEFVFSIKSLNQIKLGDALNVSGGGWGELEGGRVFVSMPELETETFAIAYGNDSIGLVAQREGFDGIAGLRFLDRFKYSGDGEQFCLQTKSRAGLNQGLNRTKGG
jgi:hypothetical protein